jgi:hypothetical protein
MSIDNFRFSTLNSLWRLALWLAIYRYIADCYRDKKKLYIFRHGKIYS